MKSRCMSITISAVCAGSKSKGRAARSIRAIRRARPCDGRSRRGSRRLRRLVGDAALGHDEDAVGQFHHLVEILAHQQHGRARVPRRHDPRPDLGHGREVEPEAGVRDDEQSDLPGQFARQHRALDVAARERGDGRVERGGLDLEGRDQRRGPLRISRATARSGGPSRSGRRCGRRCSRSRSSARAGVAQRLLGQEADAEVVRLVPRGAIGRAVHPDRAPRPAGAGRSGPPSAPSGRCPRCPRSPRPRPRDGQAVDGDLLQPRPVARASPRAPAPARRGARACGGRAVASAPIIIAAMSAWLRSDTRPEPTWRPRRRTDTSSAKAVTSRNLWVIIRTLISPLPHMARTWPSTSSASSGVSTEVGSSRIRKRRPR
jgi:hypothetical protein